MSISANDFRPGMAVLINGDLNLVVEYQHVKPGKGPAFVRAKLRSVKSQSVVSRTFNPADKFDEAFIERRDLQFQYRQGGELHFMDLGSYEPVALSEEAVGEAAGYLREEMEVRGSFHDNQLVGLDLPASVTLTVRESDPGVKGDTSKAALKPAVMETGLKVQVPLFVNPGDRIQVDTRTGQYIGRA
ncbi:MAG: elongation factor P [Candidatus Omnitrophica bacterium CG11_big_fil_rev_8_21_14_0_20_64_10]|nr:MAG: elongation factor P [Candidatus Omnitrophica bacterium CG11_big_fil_rev_8_21_14_0_20_64_10]